MADDFVLHLKPDVYAKTMANRVARERERIAVMIEAKAQEEPDAEVRSALREAAADVRAMGTAAPVVQVDQQPVTVDDGEVPADDPLPPVRMLTDEDETTAYLRSRTTFGRHAHITKD